MKKIDTSPVLFFTLTLVAALTTLSTNAYSAPGLIPNNLDGQSKRIIQAFDSSSSQTLKIAQIQTVDGYVAVKYQQFHDGIAVIGGGVTRISKVENEIGSHGLLNLLPNQAALFLTAQNSNKSTEDFQQTIQTSSVPKLTPENAAALAVHSQSHARWLNAFPELVYWEGKLAYSVAVRSKEFLGGGADILVNAHTGEILAEVPHAVSIAAIDVHSAKGQEYVLTEDDKTSMRNRRMPAAVEAACQVFSDPLSDEPDTQFSPDYLFPKNCLKLVSNSVATQTLSREANEAFENSKAVSEYYLSVHGRDSFDGRGKKIVNIVNLGRRFANAFWDSYQQIMAYGDGDGKRLGALTRSLDVSGHEQTHAVVTSSGNLVGIGETGAVNEATADFFGKMIARRAKNDQEWSIGREIMLDGSRGIRDIRNPELMSTGRCFGNKPYPVKYSERLVVADAKCKDAFGMPSTDSGFVHLNSTIFSHAMVLVFDRLGQEKTEKLLYHSLIVSFTSRTDLKMAGQAVRKSCARTLSADDCTRVDEALLIAEI